MPSRAASHTGSLINRTIESGGSIGGNSKAGVIHTSSYPNINMGYLRNRVDTGCCSYHYNDYDSDAVPNNTPPGPNSTPTDTPNHTHSHNLTLPLPSSLLLSHSHPHPHTHTHTHFFFY